MHSFLQTLRRITADFRLAMCRMNEIQFDAPWAPRRSRCR
jgi:hypothetical protein